MYAIINKQDNTVILYTMEPSVIMSIEELVKNLPQLYKQVQCLKKEIGTLSDPRLISLDSFNVNGTDLELLYTNAQGQATLSTDLSSLQQLEIKDTVLNFAALSTVTSPALYQFAYVRESQGIKWVNYKGSGLYMWDGTNWVEDDTDIFTQLQDLLATLVIVQNDLNDKLNLGGYIGTAQDLKDDIDSEATTRQIADTSLLSQIQSNDSDITDLENNKRDLTAQKNSVVDDAGDLQLENDEANPGISKVYGTNPAGIKGWYDQATGGDQAFVNEAVLYKAFSDTTPNINIPTTYSILNYKPATAGTFDNTAFAPVANGVQILKDLENVTIIGSVFVTSTGARVSIGTSIAINGVVSTIESTGYIRAASGHNEDYYQVIETFPTLSAGDVITVLGKRNAGAGTDAVGIEDKGLISVSGFIPDSPGVLLGFPAPIVTSINLV